MNDDERRALTLRQVETTAKELADARDSVRGLTADLRQHIRRAVDEGNAPAEVARVAGVTTQRVSQIAPVRKARAARSHAQKNGDAASCVTDTGTVAHLPATDVDTMSGLASTRVRRPLGARPIFLDTRTGSELPGLLYEARQQGAGLVYLTGPAPEDTTGHATRAEAVRAWAMSDPGPGWSVSPRGHYLAEPDKPTLRFVHEDGYALAIMRAASWWGETDADADTCRRAWSGLERIMDTVPAFAGAGLDDNPTKTGHALWLRTIPEGRHYPTLSDEYQELIRTTSGQGRIEVRPCPDSILRDEFTVMDGRLMYAALTWGMPVGEPYRHTLTDGWDPAANEKIIRGRGRWLITATVPADWAHVGLLPYRDGDRWTYPSEPGRRFTTWVDGSEAWLAGTHGWLIEWREGITWAEGKPLDTWRDALVDVWTQCQQSADPAAKLAAKAVRAIILYALGGFASPTAYTITRYAEPGQEPADLPPGTEVRMVGDKLMWTERRQKSTRAAQLAHPEWSATVWARARVRLLDAAGVNGQRVGALHLPADRIVGFHTDALYVAGGVPWDDDGKPGRFRCKGRRPGAFTWPTNMSELYALGAEVSTDGQ